MPATNNKFSDVKRNPCTGVRLVGSDRRRQEEVVSIFESI